LVVVGEREVVEWPAHGLVVKTLGEFSFEMKVEGEEYEEQLEDSSSARIRNEDGESEIFNPKMKR
jgi:hypothetical protein